MVLVLTSVSLSAKETNDSIYTIYGTKVPEKCSAVAVKNGNTTFIFMNGEPGGAFHMDRAFLVGISAGYESKKDFTLGAEIAYMWNKNNETAIIGGYGLDSEEWSATVSHRFWTSPAQSHNWAFFLGIGAQVRDRKYAFDATDEISHEALSMGYYVHDKNNHAFIYSPIIEAGAKFRICKNFALQISAYCGYECNKACESFEAIKKINGDVSSMIVPTTANNRSFFVGVKGALCMAFQKGHKIPNTVNY